MTNLKEGNPGKEGEKPWQVAGCSTTYVVKEFEAPTLSCSANPTNLQPGDSSTITGQGVSPQNRPLTYIYQASSGDISGSFPTSSRLSPAARTVASAHLQLPGFQRRHHWQRNHRDLRLDGRHFRPGANHLQRVG